MPFLFKNDNHPILLNHKIKSLKSEIKDWKKYSTRLKIRRNVIENKLQKSLLHNLKVEKHYIDIVNKKQESLLKIAILYEELSKRNEELIIKYNKNIDSYNDSLLENVAKDVIIKDKTQQLETMNNNQKYT